MSDLLRLDPAQYAKLMNDPIHYNVAISYNEKMNLYDVDCEIQDFRKIKQLIEEK